jgi:hypothetical protein
MYFFVPYSISDIQKGIQCGHAVEKYAYNHGQTSEYKDYIENSKTWIILNGGTTNGDLDNPGTLDQIWRDIVHFNNVHHDERIEIKKAYFQEPDLNNALTSVCFLADERVWDYETYADVDFYLKNKLEKTLWLETFKNGLWTYDDIKIKHPELFVEWEQTLGGEKNVFLRNLIKGKKLA